MTVKTCMIVLAAAAALVLPGCGKKDPCVEQWGCKDCNELFDLYQKNLHDMEKARRIRECMDKACR